MRSNCLIWAVLLAVRLRKPKRHRRAREVYLSMRKSRWGRFPHFLVMTRLDGGRFRAVSYKPLDPKARKVPPPLFHGSSKWGDL